MKLRAPFLSSVPGVKSFLEIAEVNVYSTEYFEQVLVLCHSARSNSGSSENLAKKLKLLGPPTTLTVRGKNSRQRIHTQIDEFKLTRVRSGDSRAAFSITPYERKDFNVSNDIIDVEKLKQEYPHVEPIKFSKYGYVDVEKIVGQDAFDLISPLDYFEDELQDTPVVVRLPLGWVLSVLLLDSTSGLLSKCFKAFVQTDDDSELADQLSKCTALESYTERTSKSISPPVLTYEHSGCSKT